jgi:hypothetical protein
MHRKSKTWKSRQSVVCLSLERHPLHVAGMLILGESSGQFLANGRVDGSQTGNFVRLVQPWGKYAVRARAGLPAEISFFAERRWLACAQWRRADG